MFTAMKALDTLKDIFRDIRNIFREMVPIATVTVTGTVGTNPIVLPYPEILNPQRKEKYGVNKTVSPVLQDH